MAVGLFERYQLLETRNNHFLNTKKGANQSNGVSLPLEYLGLSDTKFTDSGFKYLMQRFEAIYLQNLPSGPHSITRDIDRLMDIDLSRNSISDVSIKYLADILKKFQGFRYIKLAALSKMNQSGFVELARALRENHSLQKLDLSKNSLSQNTLAELFAALQDNFVLCELCVDIKHKATPG